MKCGPLDSTVYWKCPMALKAKYTIRFLFHGSNKCDCRHAPWSLPWCPWNAPLEIYNFLLGCPLPRRKCLGTLALSKNKAYRPEILYTIKPTSENLVVFLRNQRKSRANVSMQEEWSLIGLHNLRMLLRFKFWGIKTVRNVSQNAVYYQTLLQASYQWFLIAFNFKSDYQRYTFPLSYYSQLFQPFLEVSPNVRSTFSSNNILPLNLSEFSMHLQRPYVHRTISVSGFKM